MRPSPDPDDDLELEPGYLPGRRSPARAYLAMIVVATATLYSLGATLRMPTQLEANDISRWCTVWSLVERGTYVIDDCPWQNKTQDKVYKILPRDANKPDDSKHFYSSKPPLLPTIVAGMVYPFRQWTKVPLDASILQARVPRDVRKEDPNDPTKVTILKGEVPEPVKWPAYVFYFKPTIVVLNVIPYMAFLILIARLLDRHVTSDWAWFGGLIAAAWATPLANFNTTLNNHSVAAFAAFFAACSLLKILDTPKRSAGIDPEQPVRLPYASYASAGFWAAFAACNELPAAVFGILAFLIAASKSPKATLLAFVPAAIVPCVAFLVTLYLATGGLTPFYAEFGGPSYEGYEGSFWANPLEMDYFDKHPEPKGLYLFHMMLGHHGVFSLTPIFLLAIPAMIRSMAGGGIRQLAGLAWLTMAMTIGLVAFYVFKTNNYGGSTQGLRWLFWVYPLWLIFVGPGLESGARSRLARWFGLACLAMSAFSVGYGMRTPWSHPWVLDMIEHFNLYTLVR